MRKVVTTPFPVSLRAGSPVSRPVIATTFIDASKSLSRLARNPSSVRVRATVEHESEASSRQREEGADQPR